MNRSHGSNKTHHKTPRRQEKFWREHIHNDTIDLRGMKRSKVVHHLDLRGVKTKRSLDLASKREHFQKHFVEPHAPSHEQTPLLPESHKQAPPLLESRTQKKGREAKPLVANHIQEKEREKRKQQKEAIPLLEDFTKIHLEESHSPFLPQATLAQAPIDSLEQGSDGTHERMAQGKEQGSDTHKPQENELKTNDSGAAFGGQSSAYESQDNSHKPHSFLNVSSNADHQHSVLRRIASLSDDDVNVLGVEGTEQLDEYRDALHYQGYNNDTLSHARLASYAPDESLPPASNNPQGEENSMEETLLERGNLLQELNSTEEENGSATLPILTSIRSPISSSGTDFFEESQHKRFNYLNESLQRIEDKVSHLSFSPFHRKDLARVVHRNSRWRSLKRTLVITIALVLIAGLAVLGVLGVQLYKQKGVIIEKAQAGYDNIEYGRDALFAFDGARARDYFAVALSSFQEAEKKIGGVSQIVLSVSSYTPFNQEVVSAQRLLRAGVLYSRSGGEISNAVSLVHTLQNGTTDNSSQDILEIIESVENARTHFLAANQELMRVQAGDLPEEFQDQFSAVRTQALEIEMLLEEFYTAIPVVLDLLGYNQERTYLFLFQNSSELRATGGFIGTYGVLPVYNGEFEDIRVNGIYDPDGQITEKIVPPRPLQYVTPSWGTRDANWFFDFPTTAQNAIDLFEKSGEAHRVDGVIAVTPELVLRLLELTGPIHMEEYDVVIDRDSFLEVVQEEVEEKYDKELNRPKQILTDLTPLLLERALQGERYGELIVLLLSSLREKDIMLYSTNTQAQHLFEKYAVAGKITLPEHSETVFEDSLSVVFSNIGGGKTDLFTDDELNSVTTIEEDGSVVRTVWITRKHNGGETGYPWYDTNNYGYVRVFVPFGSNIVAADGFADEPSYQEVQYDQEGYQHDDDVVAIERTLRKHEESNTDIFEESGFTVFGNWLLTEPGSENVAYVSYRLPEKLEYTHTTYHLTLHKQPGTSVDYSGLFESKRRTRSLYACTINEQNMPIPRFRFTQEQDSVIACSILQQ